MRSFFKELDRWPLNANANPFAWMGKKANFVDEDNVFVGYDFGECCCEDFHFWFILPDGTKTPEDEPRDFPGFKFDTTRCEVIEGGDHAQDIHDNAVKFFLKNDAGDEVVLVLSNCHNGYYAHGFAMVDWEGTIIHSGAL